MLRSRPYPCLSWRHREDRMYLDVMSQDRLAELFGRAVPLPTPRLHTATHLQRKFLQALPAVQRYAIQGARLMSHSYRNFHVGAAAYCYCRRTGEFGIVNSGNVKLWKGSSKLCAEMTFLGMIDSDQYDLIVGFAVYGEQIQSDPSGLRPRTLHPCPVCRGLMAKDPRIARWTRMFTFRPWMAGDALEEKKHRYVREHMSFRKLQRAHANGNGNGNHE